jgi:dynein heavy chain, axonemal
MINDDSMIKLWAHECLRVFHDRLITQEDRNRFIEMLSEQMQEKFKKDYNKLVLVKPLLFASYVPTIYPDGDEDKKQYTDIYCEITDRSKMSKICKDALEDFNTMNRSKQMDLVLFGDAMEHCVKIHRVITTEFGHALLVGVGGSGRNSLTELATFIANFTIVKLDIPKGYTFEMWRDDLKTNLYLALAYDMQNMIFFFSDTQLIDEAFLEDINNILNNGEVPNLLSEGEDLINVIERMKEQYKADPDFKEHEGDQQWIYNKFIN